MPEVRRVLGDPFELHGKRLTSPRDEFGRYSRTELDIYGFHAAELSRAMRIITVVRR